MPRTPNDPARRKAFEDIGASLASEHGAEIKKLFGKPTINVGGKMAVCQSGGALVFKLSGHERETALGLVGAETWNPSGSRPMKNWVLVPQAHQEKWPAMGRQAILNVQKALI